MINQINHVIDEYNWLVFADQTKDIIKIQSQLMYIIKSCIMYSIYYLGGKNLPTCHKYVFIGVEMNTNQSQIHQLLE